MQIINKILRLQKVYIYFISFVLFIIIFSTTYLNAKSFRVSDVEISSPFELNFKKSSVIDVGFYDSFSNLLSMITTSGDKDKIKNISLKELKSMIDSFTIQAQRRGVITDLSWMETGQYCFTLTKDGNNIIVGTRGGSESVGQVIALPVGSVGYPSEEDEYVKRLFFGNSEMEIDPCKLATMKEGWEEGAIHPKEDLEYLDLIGVYRQDKGSAAPSNIFMYLSRLNIDGKEIIERHRRSMREYNAIKDKFKTNADSSQVEIMARTHLQILAFHLPENGWAKDAWENESLSLWPADPRDLVKMFEAKPNENLKHGMYGAIALYVLDTNENLFGRLMSLPQFKEQLKEDF